MGTYRKKLRLPDYDYSQPGAYFVTVCIKDRRCILSTIVGADAYIGPQVCLTETGKTVEKYLRRIPGVDRYVIMPNHVHMIVQIPENHSDGPMWASAPTGVRDGGPMWASAPTGVRLGDLVRSWKTLVSKELGQRIFQRAYYDHVIRNEREYIEIAEYIAGNPGKWYEDKYYFPNENR